MLIKTIGIIGGGQLGMMMTEAAHNLGFKVVVLDPTPNSSCGQIAEKQIIAEYDDIAQIETLCRQSDVVTYEFENVPYQVIENFQKSYNIPQGFKPLYYSQHRIREKRAAEQAGVLCGDYRAVNSLNDLEAAVREIGFPCVLKTCSGGYDGKGQLVLKSEADLSNAAPLPARAECILEKFIPFDYEISVIVTRSITGEMTLMPVGKNIHKDNILFMTIHPSHLPPVVEKKASEIAQSIMNNLDIVGTMAIEMFVVGDEVYFNEMAPRPHNSGHYSIEACHTSQFEQHIRAVTGMPLGNTALKCRSAIMVNVLGQHYEGMQRLKQECRPQVYVHDYGKGDARHNRKMGHVTFIDYDLQTVESIIKNYWQ